MSRDRTPDPVVLGIDIGTSRSKGVACRPDGTVVAQATRAHDVDRPAPGWVEHDAEAVWWGDAVALCRDLVEAIADADLVRAVAVTTCGPCLLPVDRDGRPLRPGILYGVDTRAADEIERLGQRIGAASIRRRTGMPLTSQSIGPKLAWVAHHEPEVARRTAVWHTATSFIVERLTGVAAIDHHQASYFGPFIDAQRRAWDLRAADDAGLPGLARTLPDLRWPREVAGGITAAAAASTGVPAGVPVLVGTSDGPMEALAVGATVPGIVAITHGSTTTLTALAAPPGRAPGLWLTEGLGPEQPCVGAGVSTTGALLRWAGGILAPGLDPADADRLLEREAAASPPGANGLLVVPSFAGESTPFFDPSARGVISGLTLAHGRGDISRAILEGIAFGIRELLEAYVTAGLPVDRLRAAGGGTANALALQLVSDVTGRSQDVAATPAGAALGAARLAAEAVGFAEAGVDWFVADRRIEPDRAASATYDERYAAFRRLVRETRHTGRALAVAAR
jgi:xylulokinase